MIFEPLSREHDRESFDCGEESLNVFLRQYAHQQAKRFVGRTFVAVETPGDSRILGYYTLAAGAVDASILPTKEGLQAIPVVLLGRLAVDKECQGRGLAGLLLMDALARAHRIARQDLGVYAVVVDALNDRARAFYEHFGFTRLLDDPLHMFLTMKKISALDLNPAS